MKKASSKFYFLGIAATLALPLVGCSSSDDMGDEPAAPANEVKTQFAISIGSGSQGSRQTPEVAQANGQAFRGIDNITIVAYNVDDPSMTNISLTQMVPSAVFTLDEIGGLSSSQSSTVYSNVTVPLNATHFLFFGKAPRATRVESGQYAPGVENNLHFGLIAYRMGGMTDPTAFGTTQYFSHEPIYSSKSATAFANTPEAAALLNVLNAIQGVRFTTADGQKNATEVLGLTFPNYISGSSKAVQAHVNNLLDFLGALTPADGSVQAQAKDALMALFTASSGAVKDVFDYNATSNAVSFKSMAHVDNFPGYYGLPDGAALVYFNGSKYVYVTEGKMESNVITAQIDKYVYPSELTYYVASPILASNTSLEANQWSKTPLDWTTNPAQTNVVWGNKVLSTSKAVALANNVNYGVAQLKTTVKTLASTIDYIDPSDNSVKKTPALNLPFSAIVVGGQPQNLVCNFVSTDGAFDNVVYDVVEGITASASEPTKANYTLLFDNKKTTGSEPEKVNVALEFVNNTGLVLKGVDGDVWPGMKFYVVGQLDPAAPAAGSAIDWSSISSTNAAAFFPGYNDNRVFVQDFTTTANFTLQSLKNIYVTIPDLRATQIAFGLSVDLTWKSGLTFDITIE